MNNLGKISKKMVALLAVFAVIVYNAMPLSTIFADDVYTVNFQAEEGHSVTSDANGNLLVDGITVSLIDSNNQQVGSASCNDETHCYISYSDPNFVGQLSYNSDGAFDLFNTNGHVKYTFGNDVSNGTVFLVEDADSTAPTEEFGDINVSVSFVNTEGEVVLNDNGDTRISDGTQTFTNAGYIDNSNQNKISITTWFTLPVPVSIKVNDVPYPVSGTDMNELFVDGNTDYDIVVEADSSQITKKTIIWVNPDYVPEDEEDAQWASQFAIEHGYAKVKEVYDENNTLIPASEYVVDQSTTSTGGVKDGFGHVSIYPGSRVIFEFVPEYGYQLTDIKINEQSIGAGDSINSFEFEMLNGGNIHFAATFTKTDDTVKANSEKVSSGEITLGNTLEGGTAQLTVNDIDLDSDKIKDFESAAGDYKISNYLDIDLYNIYYKGKNDDSDVWSKKIDELDNEATITIKLEDGVNGNDIVIVHNVHDGDEFEIIPTTYDEATNTITFKTKSFSNYAIASKTVENTSNVKTGDNIMIYVSLLGLSTIALLILKILNKRKRNVK